MHPRRRLTRSEKTNRAYTLAIAGTGSGVVAIVLLACFLGFLRTVT